MTGWGSSSAYMRGYAARRSAVPQFAPSAYVADRLQPSPVCYHEASHAVVGLSLGFTLHEVCVNAPGGYGYTARTVPDRRIRRPADEGDAAGHFRALGALARTQQERSELEGRMTEILAGEIGQLYATGDRDGAWASASEDRRRAQALALGLAGGDDRSAGLLMDEIWARGHALVERHWPLIERVANALNRQGSLSSQEVWRAMRGA